MPPLYQQADDFVQDNKGKVVVRMDLDKQVGDHLLHLQHVKDPDYYTPVPGEVHVSSLTRCLRGVVHEMLGAEKSSEIDARQAGVFQAGNLFEDFVMHALGDRVLFQQRQYEYHLPNGLILKGRSDYGIDDNGIIRLGENKSMHSKGFWYMEKAKQPLKYQHRIQLNTYLWLERELDAYQDVHGNTVLTNKPREGLIPMPQLKLPEPQGIFSYISKDDCMTKFVAVEYVPELTEQLAIPTLDLIAAAYKAKDPSMVPHAGNHWMGRYCDYHAHCLLTENGQQTLEDARNQRIKENAELADVELGT